MSYLADLTARLADGAKSFPPDLRRRHADYLRRAQCLDGGFSGRDRGSDLYYTGFGLRGLAMLGMLDESVARSAALFLRQQFAHRTGVVDDVSLIHAACLLEMVTGTDVVSGQAPRWRADIAAVLAKLRRNDGGYARSPDGAVGSTYQTFLVAASLLLLGVPLADRRRMVEFVLSRRREDGGFVEIGPMKRSGTNPTAAAIGLLKMAGALDDEVRHETIDFLSRMQTEEGGMRANTRIADADLLSTFCAVLTLADLEGLHEIDRAAASGYVLSLALPSGGFRGASWDPDCDVEYTFYGLAVLALLGDSDCG